jgi:hypothetical protein
MASFNDFVDALGTDLAKYVETSWKTYKTASVKDGNAFFQKLKGDLERWTKMLASGGLTRDDFEWLVVGKKDLAELAALKQKGLAKVALDRFLNGLVDTFVTTAFRVFL